MRRLLHRAFHQFADTGHAEWKAGCQPKGCAMNCRDRCGACCIAPSISSSIPGMESGKPAGVRCIQLDDADRCKIFGRPERPAVCGSLQ
ncbi:MAG TPA: YkgJ family cysteine cluster protein, partial [Burkholderiaceae bacterium]